MRHPSGGLPLIVYRAVGVSWTPASTGSSLRGKAGLSERTLTPMGAGGGVGCATGEQEV